MSFDAVFADGEAFLRRQRDGQRIPLEHRRWLGEPDAVDLAVAAAVTGPVLDVGCGPGRLLDALAVHGIEALGLDLSPAAVALARARGRAVRLGSVFDGVHGRWSTALLLDGSVGIGGDPELLLRRTRELADTAVVEVGGPGTGTRAGRVRVEAGDVHSPWFDWAHVDVDGIAAFADVQRIERIEERWFAWLR